VTNTGSVAGDAVAQLYVKHLKSKVDRPREELKGFQRVMVQPNETKTVSIPLKAADLAYWDERQNKFVVEAEPVGLMLGESSADIKLNSILKVQ
jgi:beta-glucosidase